MINFYSEFFPIFLIIRYSDVPISNFFRSLDFRYFKFLNRIIVYIFKFRSTDTIFVQYRKSFDFYRKKNIKEHFLDRKIQFY